MPHSVYCDNVCSDLDLCNTCKRCDFVNSDLYSHSIYMNMAPKCTVIQKFKHKNHNWSCCALTICGLNFNYWIQKIITCLEKRAKEKYPPYSLRKLRPRDQQMNCFFIYNIKNVYNIIAKITDYPECVFCCSSLAACSSASRWARSFSILGWSFPLAAFLSTPLACLL